MMAFNLGLGSALYFPALTLIIKVWRPELRDKYVLVASSTSNLWSKRAFFFIIICISILLARIDLLGKELVRR